MLSFEGFWELIRAIRKPGSYDLYFIQHELIYNIMITLKTCGFSISFFSIYYFYSIIPLFHS